MTLSSERRAESTASQPIPAVVVRKLLPEDLAAVVALDRKIGGRARSGYFEKRLQAALRWPRRHLQYALTTGQGLVGFLLARRAAGEYGRPEEVVVLEAVGVDPSAWRTGCGRKLLAAVDEWMRAHQVRDLVTQVDWRNHAMVKFLAGAGFSLEARQILERPLDRLPLPADDEEIEKWPPVVRNLRRSDFETVVRVDQRISKVARRDYFERKFDEALDESAIAVSLVAEADGFLVAFAMARVDHGDFGHIEESAALDTIGVDPSFENQGFATALLSQMIENLAALHVERLETEVANGNFGLLRFLFEFGFGPSQRLCFRRRL